MNAPKYILITDFVHKRLLDGLQDLGYEIEYHPQIPYEDVFNVINKYHGIIINSKVKMTKELIDLGTNLKFIARLGSGLDIIDLDRVREKGIHVFSAPDGNRVAVAEHALGMLLMLANKLKLGDWQVRNLQWDREACRGWELEGKNIGIIGFGNNGSAFAERLAGFGVNVYAFDKYKKQFGHLYDYVQEVELSEIQRKCDIISFHVPLNEETKYYFDSTFLENCLKPIVLINTSRGKIVKTETVLAGIESKKIVGACLDVFENEKPLTYNYDEKLMYEKLFEVENVLFSPHVAGWTKESFFKISDIILRQISALADF